MTDAAEAPRSAGGRRGPPLVAVGASAGGLEAFEALLRSAPPASGLTFALLIHLDPKHESSLSEILDRRTPIAVRPMVSGAELEPDTAYVIPPGKFASMKGGKLYLTSPPPGEVPKMVIDRFFRSMAEDLGPAAIGVVMSGTGDDGSLGIRAIRDVGGLTIAQREETAAYPGMPTNAISTGDVDHVLPPGQIIEKVLEFVRHPAFVDRSAVLPAESDLERLIELVRYATGHDFSHYKRPTISRRVTRRLQVLGLESVHAYVEYVGNNPQEPGILFRDLLIRVTGFFRDPEAFELLKEQALPRLSDQERRDSIRVWVPGCATGEEAYTLAILLFEYLSSRGDRTDFHVFATDVDPQALDVARRGVYPASIASDVTPERLERFFVREGDGYRVVDAVRDRIVFAPQDVAGDPPFSNMDLVSCRNLLIYMDATLQERILPLFHYALNPGGILLLGPSENIGEHANLFSEVDRKWRIFQRRSGATAARLRFAPVPWTRPRAKDAMPPGTAVGDPRTIEGLVQQALLQRFAPPSVLIDKRGEILHVFGRTAPYLELPAGQPAMNVYKLAQSPLEADLRTAVHRALREHRPVQTDGLEVRFQHETRPFTLSVSPLEPSVFGDELLLVAFQPVQPPKEVRSRQPGDEAEVLKLRSELRATKEYLQATIEELETSNEELASSNEELLSMNQEYQSTNEELETSREELQSVNEELSTVNTELKNKVEELAAANADVRNLHESTGVATLFVDRELRVRTFTPPVRRLFGVSETDRGRPLSDLAQRFEFAGLESALGRVRDSEQPLEQEVTAADRWYVMRLLPYHAANGSVGGVILTFVDITSIKEAQLEVEGREARLRGILDTTLDAIVTIDSAGRIQWFNDAAEGMFGYAAEEVIGENVKVLMPPPHRDAHDGYLERYVRTGEKHIVGYRREVLALRKDGKTFPVSLGVAEVRFDDTLLFTAIIQDLTERRALEEELRQAQKMEAVGTLASGVAHDFNNLLMGLIGCADIAKSRLDPEHPARRYVIEIHKAAKNGTSIASQLLAFSRRRRPESMTLDLNRVVTDTREMLQRLLGEDVRLEQHAASEGLWVQCDLGQIEQILMNLAANARHAMPGGGSLRISTSSGTLSQRQLEVSKAKPGRYAVLSVADTGFGMGDETKRRIFEPFFTTKPSGQGTGLGLSTVYGIVQQNGGHIDVESELGKGSTFRIYLPLVERPMTATSAPVAAVESGSETVLLVEDAPLVRESTRHYLEAAGYRVIAAADGRSAQSALETHASEIDLLLTDVVLPDIGGLEIARLLRDHRSTTPVLFMSAHPAELLRERGQLGPEASTLQKPIARDALLLAVRAALDVGVRRPVVDAANARVEGAGARRTLLVVEDEHLARMTMSELLGERGFRILQAESAATARLLFGEHVEHLDAVVLDVKLPDGSGTDLAVAFRERKPELGIVFTSGLPDGDPELATIVGSPHTEWVTKPVEVSELADVIDRVIAAQCAAEPIEAE